MKTTLVALDLAKESIEVFATNDRGSRIERRKVYRDELFQHVSNRFVGAKVVMEACGMSHYWGRRFQRAGFHVRLIPAQHVLPFRRGGKNDRNDARAIAAAASRADMSYVAVKPEDQQVIQCYHRVRERLVASNTEIMNQIRSLLAEFGVTISRGRRALGVRLSELEKYQLPEPLLKLVSDMKSDLLNNERRIDECTKYLKSFSQSNDLCRRLMTIPGVGPIIATALYSKGNHREFKKARQFAASFGVVPRQHTTGGKERLGRITKSGDSYIRKLAVHGARSFIRTASKHENPYGQWVERVRERQGCCKAAVALANRNFRIAWAIMSGKQECFDPYHVPEQFRRQGELVAA